MRLHCAGLSVFIIFVSVISSWPAKAEISFHSVANLSDSDRVILTVRQLDRGIQKELTENIIKSLGAAYRSSDILVDSVETRFQNIFDRLDGLSTKSGESAGSHKILYDSPVFRVHDIEPVSISRDTAQLDFTAYLGNNPAHLSSRINLKLANWLGKYGITNIFEVTDSLDALLDLAESDTTFLFKAPGSYHSNNYKNSTTWSGNFLKNKIVHPGGSDKPVCPVFTKNYANNNFGGKNLFGRPFDAFETVVRSFGQDHWAMLVSDANWDRIIYLGEKDGNQVLSALDLYDNSNQSYRYPAGIAVLTDQDLFVCDKYHNRIASYWFDINDIVISDNVTFSYNDFDQPVDIDAAHYIRFVEINPQGYEVYNQLAICDWGNDRIVITGRQGGYVNEIGGHGSGPWELDHPTSVAYGRDVDGWHNLNLYVADDGNKRIVRYYHVVDLGGMVYDRTMSTADGIFPENSYLTCVEVDNVGQVYALDSYNGVIYTFSPDNLELIDTCGQIGTDTGSYYYPARISVTEGWHEVNDPILGEGALFPTQFGDMLLTEIYSDSTGIKRYELTNKLLGFNTDYVPRNCNHNDDYAHISWQQASYGYAKISIIGPGFVDRYTSVYNHGEHSFLWSIPYNAAENATYTANLNLYSLYDTIHPVALCQENIQCQRDTCNYPPNFINWPYIVGNDTCVIYGHTYQCAVDVEDRNSNNNSLIYKWQTNRGFFDDNATPEWDYIYDTLTTVGKDRINIMIYPNKDQNAIPEIIFTVTVLDGMGGQITGSCLMEIVGPEENCSYIPPPPYCPVLYWDNNGEWQLINNLLAESDIEDRPDLFVNEIYPVQNITSYSESVLRLRIAEEAEELTTLQNIKAFAIDYPDTLNLIYSAQNDPYILTDKYILPSLVVANGKDTVTSLLANHDGFLYTSNNPGEIVVEYEFPRTSPVYYKPLSDAPGGPVLPPPDKGISKKPMAGDTPHKDLYEFYVQNGNGSWQSAAKLYPRLERIDRYVELSEYIENNKLVLKIEHGGPIELDYIPYCFFKPADFTTKQLPLVSAIHSNHGDVSGAIADNTSSGLTLSTGEYLDLAFQNPDLQKGHKRLLLVASRGMYDFINDDPTEGEPFSFDQNYPNPFNPNTNFSFHLPRPAYVSLKIFNVLGQTVKTLIDKPMPTGRHTVSWNSRNESREYVASGVYFARIIAGEFSATKKIEVLK